MKSILKFIPLFILFIFSSSFGSFQDEGESLSLIANSSTQELSMKEAKKLLKGEEQRWKDGTKVAVALMKTTTPIGETTAKTVYKMSSKDLNKYWLGLVFAGKAQAPTFFTSEEELKAFVNSTPGAIGIVSASSAGSKAVKVDGNTSL